MKNINRIAILNICSTILLQGIAFFTTPIFTKILGSEQYGLYSIFNSWLLILNCILGLGVTNSLSTGRYLFRNKYYEFRSSILLFGTSISLIMIGIPILLLIKPISDYLGYSNYMVILLFITGLSSYIIGFIQKACIYEKNAELNFFISIALSITSVIFSLLLIPGFKQNYKFIGRILGTSIPYSLMAVIMWFVFFLKKPTGLHRNYCIYGLTVGFPTVFHSLAHNILAQSDRLMMQRMNISNSEIGVYSFFCTIVGVMSTILNVLNTTWSPYYYDDVDAENWNKLKIKCKNYMELFLILTIGFLLLSREVSCLLTEKEYWNGINIIPLITLSIYFTFIYQFLVNFEIFYRKTIIIAVGTVGAAIINIILNLSMIPLWGMYGAAVATTMSYGILFIFHYFIVTHIKDHPYHLKINIFIPGMLIVCVVIILFYFLKNYFYIRWACGIFIGGYELRKVLKRKSIF